MTSHNHAFRHDALESLHSLIVDDESSGRDALRALLAAHCPQVVVVAEAASVREAQEMIRRSREIDIIFLDIELPDGSGFDVLEEAGPRQFEVIFVTAYDNYGIQAVKAAAADYLLKPVSPNELRDAVDRAAGRIRARAENYRAAGEIPERIALPNAQGLRIVETANIVRCRSHSNYTEFRFIDGDSLLVSRPMGEFERVLVRSGFFRVHNSHLINMRHIRSYVRGKGGYVVMADGSHVDVSVRRKEAFLKMLNG